MEKDPAGPFRTKVRVKAAGSKPDQPAAVVQPQAPAQQPGSLMEALKQARRPPAGAHPRDDGVADGTTEQSPRSRRTQQAAGPENPHRPKPPRPARTRMGRLASAKLRQLERLKEAAASLESLARGETEEATVEIIRRDSRRPRHRGPAAPAQKR